MLYKVEAVVIRSMDYGEGNKIITLYTREFGKVGVVARGAKKVKSRISAMTQLFSHGEYTYYRTSQLGTLNHGELLSSHHALREDIQKTAYAAHIVELIDRMLAENEGSSYIFEQLIAALQAIEDDKDLQIVTHLFELKMLTISGYAPVMEQCVSCGSELSSGVFSISIGGMMCTACRSQDPSAIRLSDKAYKLIRIMQQLDIRRLGKIEVSTETKAELKQVMRSFLDTHVSTFWKARKFLDQIEKYDL